MSMKVHAPPIPEAQTLNSKGVAQIVWPWSHTATRWLQAGPLEKLSQCVFVCADGKFFTVCSCKEAVIRLRPCNSTAFNQILIELSRQGAMHGDPAGSPFKHIHENETSTCIHVTQTETKGLTEA